MVQFVFIHGVNNRDTAERNAADAARNANIESLVFGDGVRIQSPLWGELAANPPGGVYASVPDYDNPTADGVEHLGLGDKDNNDAGEETQLIALARVDFPETVDLVIQSLLEAGELDEDQSKLVRSIGAYAVADPNPTWIEADLTNDQFLDHLEAFALQYRAGAGEAEEDETETLGLGAWFRDGAQKFINSVRNKGGRLALDGKRASWNAVAARFIGDVFVYLQEDAKKNDIRQVIHDALQPAIASGDQLVVMGHSLGGVILVDCLSDPDFCQSIGLTGDKQIDVLLTVGSQPGFFHELGLLASRGNTKVDSVRHWLNIYDELDVLSFRAAPLFPDQAKDMLFSSKTGLLSAHSAYFSRIQFYERLRIRLADLGIDTL